MKFKVTAGSLIGQGIWHHFCLMTGTNEFGIAEGRFDHDETFEISQDQAEQLGLTIDLTIDQKHA